MIVVAWVVSRPSAAHTGPKMPQAARVPPDAEDRWTMTVLPSTPQILFGGASGRDSARGESRGVATL